MTLLDEILAGETAELEFKEARPKDALKYVKTAVAFANGRGGRLVFGVENETRRNDGLALALSYMKEVEGWGGGVARYFTDWTKAGLPRPRLEETPGFFKVVFDRKRKANEPLNEPLNETVNETLNETVNDTVNETVKNIVANLIRKAPGIGSAALVSAVGKSRATVMRAVALLKQQGIIEHRGSDKTGGYFPAASAQKEAK